jgi:hypothetical protein
VSIEDLFAQIEDQSIEGGCDCCNAVQVVKTISPGIFELTVMHDDWCPAIERA